MYAYAYSYFSHEISTRSSTQYPATFVASGNRHTHKHTHTYTHTHTHTHKDIGARIHTYNMTHIQVRGTLASVQISQEDIV